MAASYRIGYYREQCTPPLTQRGLAAALGIHLNTVTNWEREGVPSPAALLRLSTFFVECGVIGNQVAAVQFWNDCSRNPMALPPELGQLFPAHCAPQPVAAAPIRMPLHRNPLFVGRTQELAWLAEALHAEDVAIISGIGGLGKTQLACEFVHRYRQSFPGGVFWLSFADAQSIAAEVAACGDTGLMELRPDYGQRSLSEQVQLVLAAWRQPTARLLVFDNCEDEALLAQWLPTTGGCRVLVTSRRARWDATLGTRVLPLGTLQRHESIAFLRRHNPDSTDDDTLDAIARALGDLPLALHLAGNYLKRYQEICTPTDYLRQLHVTPALLMHPSLATNGISPTRHSHHLAQTFAVSYDQLDPQQSVDRLAQHLLIRASFFAPGEPIPRDLLVNGSATEDCFLAADALTRLTELGLLEPAATSTVKLHRLVGTFIQTRHQDAAEGAEVGTTILDFARQLIDHGTPAEMRAIQVHLRFALETALVKAHHRPHIQVESARFISDRTVSIATNGQPDTAEQQRMDLAADLSATLGMHLIRLAAYHEVRPYFQQALELRRQTYGDLHETTIDSLILLGIDHQYCGEVQDALTCYREALRRANLALAETNPRLPLALSHLGYQLGLRGAFDEAEPLLRRAALLAEAIYGPEHHETASHLNDYGYFLVLQSNPDAARPYLERALAIRERTLGRQRPRTVQSLNNLGEMYHASGDLRMAHHYHQQALAGRVALFGERHHGVAESYRNLGMLALDQEQPDQAIRLARLALEICEETLGPASRDTALAHEALAEVYLAIGQRATACDHYQQALKVLGEFYFPDSEPLRRLQTRTEYHAPALTWRESYFGAAASLESEF